MSRTTAWSSAARKLERSRGANGFGPLVIAPALRRLSIRLRVASVMPIESLVNARPFGAMTSAPAFTQRLASGTSAVTTMSPARALRDPVVGLIHAGADDHALDKRIPRDGDRAVGDDEDFELNAFERVALGDAIDFLLHRAGVGVDVDGDSHLLRPAAVMAGLVPAIHVLL